MKRRQQESGSTWPEWVQKENAARSTQREPVAVSIPWHQQESPSQDQPKKYWELEDAKDTHVIDNFLASLLREIRKNLISDEVVRDWLRFQQEAARYFSYVNTAEEEWMESLERQGVSPNDAREVVNTLATALR